MSGSRVKAPPLDYGKPSGGKRFTRICRLLSARVKKNHYGSSKSTAWQAVIINPQQNVREVNVGARVVISNVTWSPHDQADQRKEILRGQ